MQLFILSCLLILSAVQLGQASSPPGGFSGGAPVPWQPRQPVASASFRAVIESLCNTTKTAESKDQDACFGCFSRVCGKSKSNKALEELKGCAGTYLEGSEYQTCTEDLKSGSYDDDAGNNSTVFCDFETCVNRVQKEELIRQCIEEVSKTGGKSAVEDFVSTSTCILAKSRCQLKNNPTEQYYDPNTNYCLMVTDDKTMRVTRLPFGGGLESTCSYNPAYGMATVKQADWSSVTC